SPGGDRWVRSSGRPIFDEAGVFRGYRGTGSDVTAQVEAEQETRRALALFRSAIESIPDGFSLYDADDRFVTCNSVTLKMMGETASFARPGMPFESIVRSAIEAGFIPAAADDPEGYVRRRMEQHRNPAGPIEVENRMRWLRIHESRMPDGGTVIIHTDITARVTAERETGRALELFRSAIDSMPDGFALFDPEDRFVTCNEPYRKLMGRSGITVEPGTPFESIVRMAAALGRTPEADADPEAFIRRRMERHRDPKGPFEVQGAGGWVRIQESRMPDGGTVNILTDITSQVEAQRETQRALALFESAIASIPDGFALFDADDRFVTCNEPYRKPVGEPAIDIERGATFESLIRGAVDHGFIPDAVEDPEGWINRRMELHRNPKGPFELERKNRWLRIQESRMADGGTVVVLTDITREKQREEQLRQTQKMDALGKLTGGLAHDFNNLLAVIAGNIELLAEELPDRPDLLAKARAAIRASERGATLTRSLLAFARQQPLQPDQVDLNRLVSDLHELIRRTIPENIAVSVATHQGLWDCTADAGQLQNALLNLVVNARDAMPDGGTLTIQTAATRIGEDAAAQHGGIQAGDYAMLAVTDTGTGMAPEVVHRAFEPFFTMKPVGKGTGLGLSMVYGFARQSGGHAAISSTVGTGTTVRLWLPRWKIAATPRNGAGSYEVRHTTGGEKVMVVEDDPDLLALIASQLGSLGYGVAQASSGPDALDEIARHEDIALLLTDVVLAGGMMGPDLARHALAKRPGLRILLMSGYAEDTVLRDGLLVSGARLLAKPFTLAQLSAAIRDALDGDAEECRSTGQV
ncbi:MAG: PAS-domain containing protein, partial [Alphaproteobacteria bacterium]